MKRILGLLLLSSSMFSMQLDIVKRDKQIFDVVQFEQQSHKTDDLTKVYIARQSVFVPNRLGSLELSHSKKGFCIHKDGKKHPIKRYNIDPMVRDFTKEQLQSFLAVGYFCINQMSNDEYSLKANGRINGGGPLFGTIMYWVTKSVCYGVAAVGIGGAAIATAGTGVAVVTGAGAAVVGGTAVSAGVAAGAGAGIATTAGVVLTGGAGAVVAGTSAVAGGIATASAAGATVAGVSLTTAATITTVGGVTAAAGTGAAATIGTGAACVAAIESASLAVGTFFGMLPTP